MKNSLKGKPIDFISSFNEEEWNNLNPVEQNYCITRLVDSIDSSNWGIEYYKGKIREIEIRDEERKKANEYLQEITGLYKKHIGYLEAQVPSPDILNKMVQQERKDAVNTYVTTKDEIKKHDFKDYELQRNSHQIAKASQYRKKETSRDDKQVIMFKISANLEKHLKTYRQVEIWKTFMANNMDLDKTAAALGVQPTQAKKQTDKISKMLKIAVQKEFEEKNTPKKIKKDIFT